MSIEQCHDILRKVVPELDGLVYIGVRDPSDPWPGSDVAALASARCQHWIAERNPAVASMATIIFRDPESINPGRMIHEACHLAPYAKLFRWRASEPPKADPLDRGERIAMEARILSPAFPWEGHGLSFIRDCLHAVHRYCRAFGVDFLDLDTAGIGGGDYELSSGWDYRRALGNEPSNLAGVPLSRIHEFPMPDAFLELFKGDKARYLSREAR